MRITYKMLTAFPKTSAWNKWNALNPNWSQAFYSFIFRYLTTSVLILTQSTAFEQECFHRSHSLFRAFGYYKDIIVEHIIPAGYRL